MKQEAAADALGVSQAYISRLEAGGLEPSPEIAERIDSLLRPPEHRAHFDHWRVAIRHCPGFSTLIRQHDDHICLVEISRGLRRLGEPFTSFNPGQRIGPDLGPDIARLLEEFAATGILEGTVGRVEDVWSFQADGKHFYFESVSTPVRDDLGYWHAYSCHMPVERETYLARLEAGRPQVVAHHDSGV